MTGGYFASLTRRTASGWVDAQSGAPPSLDAVINGERSVPIGAACFRAQESGRLSFDARLPLQPGDRVEIVDRTTRAPIAGGVRMVPRRFWRPRIAIVAPVKSEAPRLLEWISYHRVLGIRQFYLADNGGDDGTSELLQALDRAGIIVRLDWQGAKFFQLDFYNKVIPKLVGLADIVTPIDVDEFYRPLDGRSSIPEAVCELFADPAVIVLGVNWAVYGSSGRVSTGDGLVLERFTRRAPRDFEGNNHLKCFIRTEYFIPNNPNPHFYNFDRPGGRFADTRSEPLVWQEMWRLGITDKVTWNALRLDHYMVKSQEEFEQRKARGSVATFFDARDDAQFTIYDRNEVLDPAAADLISRTKTEMKRIQARIESAPRWWQRFDPYRRHVRARLAQSHFR